MLAGAAALLITQFPLPAGAALLVYEPFTVGGGPADYQAGDEKKEKEKGSKPLCSKSQCSVAMPPSAVAGRNITTPFPFLSPFSRSERSHLGARSCSAV
jgi:hypothetical protein